MQDLRKALIWVWLILSATGIGTLGMLAACPQAARILPQCTWKAQGRECVACGLTTAFCALTRGDLAAARSAHPAALPFALLCGLNGAGAGLYLIRKRTNRA